MKNQKIKERMLKEINKESSSKASKLENDGENARKISKAILESYVHQYKDIKSLINYSVAYLNERNFNSETKSLVMNEVPFMFIEYFMECFGFNLEEFWKKFVKKYKKDELLLYKELVITRLIMSMLGGCFNGLTHFDTTGDQKKETLSNFKLGIEEFLNWVRHNSISMDDKETIH